MPTQMIRPAQDAEEHHCADGMLKLGKMLLDMLDQDSIQALADAASDEVETGTFVICGRRNRHRYVEPKQQEQFVQCTDLGISCTTVEDRFLSELKIRRSDGERN